MNIRSTLKSIINNILNVFDLEISRVTLDVSHVVASNKNENAKKSEMDMKSSSDKNLLAFDQIYSLRTTMEQVLVQCKALGLVPKTVIDVGVANGTPALYSVFDESKHLLMEPIKEYEPDLKRICETVNAEYMLAAASSENGTTIIYIGEALHGSSIMQPPEGKKQQNREIKLIKLDDVCRDKNLLGPFVLKVDVQGAELMVLEGASEILPQCELVILEVSFFNFRPDMPDIYDVVRYMKEKGFAIYEIFSGHNRPLDGARAQADIAFVRDNGMFRKNHQWSY